MVSRLLIVLLLPFVIAAPLVGTFGRAAAEARLSGVGNLASDTITGRAFFKKLWVSAPSSTTSSDGLGPMFDARACASCHPKAGPGPVAMDAQGRLEAPGFILRLARADGEPDPVYGAQFNTRSVQGQPAEGLLRIKPDSKAGRRRFEPALEALSFGPLAPETQLSLRRAPNLKGIGRLARVPEAVILARAALPQADGIQGRPNWLRAANGQKRLGRFGWKAAQPDLEHQAAIAFSRDMGLSTAYQPAPWGDCSAREKGCRLGPHGAVPGSPEVAPAILEAIVRYLARLPSPTPAAADRAGAALFARTGCAACHALLTDDMGRPLAAYTDLLLHDLGPGLADGVTEGQARGQDWRTAPLWGLSASLAAGGLLHDGRARTVEEAIGWHEGEAARVRARYFSLSAADRQRLLTFLGHL